MVHYTFQDFQNSSDGYICNRTKVTSQLCASRRVHTNAHTQAALPVIKHCRNESLYWSFKHMAQGEGSPNNLNYWSALGRRLSAGVFAALSVDGRHIRMSDLVGSLALDENDNGYSDTHTHTHTHIQVQYQELALLRTRRRVRAAALSFH